MDKIERTEYSINNQQERFIFSIIEKGTKEMFEAELEIYDCLEKRKYHSIFIPRFTYCSTSEFEEKIYKHISKGIEMSRYLSVEQKENIKRSFL